MAITIKDSGDSSGTFAESAANPRSLAGFGYRPIWEGRIGSGVQPLAIIGGFAVAIVVFAFAMSAPLAGVLLAGILGVGSTLAVIEDRRLSSVEATVLGLLHVAAFVVFAL